MHNEKLRSLAIFLDVVFALMFFRIVEFLPSFQDGHMHREARTKGQTRAGLAIAQQS